MRKLLFLLVLSITGLLALAQETRVTGKVTTATGEPVAGASVVVKGQSKGAATNAAGNFTITVPKGATLVVTSIGFAPQEITANNTNLTATLIADNIKNNSRKPPQKSPSAIQHWGFWLLFVDRRQAAALHLA